MWFWLYFIVFTVVAVVDTHDSFESERKLGYLVTMALGDALAGAGLLFWRFRPDVPYIYTYWDVGAVFFTATLVFGVLADMLHVQRTDEWAATAPPREVRNAKIFATVCVVILMGPAVWINFQVAR